VKCECGRPKCTGPDFERWETEMAQWLSAAHEEKAFNPEWAKAICWTKPDFYCLMRPLQQAEVVP
jgi:hypothetical protein